jgi:hypothetical protein
MLQSRSKCCGENKLCCLCSESNPNSLAADLVASRYTDRAMSALEGLQYHEINRRHIQRENVFNHLST